MLVDEMELKEALPKARDSLCDSLKNKGDIIIAIQDLQLSYELLRVTLKQWSVICLNNLKKKKLRGL